jgi:hypothetical protein
MNIDTCLMLRRWNGERPQISLCTTISLLWSRPAGVVGQVLSAFSDSTVEWRVPTWRVALSYGVGTEEVADTAGTPRAMWMGGALFTQLHLVGPWSVAIGLWNGEYRKYVTQKDQARSLPLGNASAYPSDRLLISLFNR